MKKLFYAIIVAGVLLVSAGPAVSDVQPDAPVKGKVW